MAWSLKVACPLQQPVLHPLVNTLVAILATILLPLLGTPSTWVEWRLHFHQAPLSLQLHLSLLNIPKELHNQELQIRVLSLLIDHESWTRRTQPQAFILALTDS